MKHPTRPRRALVLALALVGLGAAGTACSPEQMALWHSAHQQVSAQLVSTGISNPIGDDVLARLRECESNGDYTAISPNGSYRGAYQFSRRTWDNVARTYAPSSVGVDPAAAPPMVQDHLARALWSEEGSRPWPVCGRRAA